jgi:mycoredoxin
MGKTVTMYWRPGCGFCAALERQLVKHEIPFAKRNIWEEPEAAAYVRSVARGHETVPTVTVGETSLVNPSLAQVVELLAG